MCSPEVMAKVRQSTVSRRGVLGLVGAAGALTVAGSVTRPRHAVAQEATPSAGVIAPGGFTSVRDLTHTSSETFPMYPGAKQMQILQFLSVANDGYYKNQLIFDEHTGTHMDSPAHFAEDGTTADKLPVAQLVAPLAVINIFSRTTSDPDTQVTVDDIATWEQENGPLPAGAFVAMYSGWERRLIVPKTYINLDAEGVQHYPGFHPDAAAFLVNERDIVGIGVDTLSLDFGASTDFGTHLTVLPAGKYGIENLANLGTVPPSGATIVVGGPKHLNASGGPTRALALF